MTRRYSKSDLVTLKQDLGAALPPPVPRKKRNNEEWEIQRDFISWWRSECCSLGVWEKLLYHIPNGSMLGDHKQARIIRAEMLRLAGVQPGVPDCFLAVPRISGGGPNIEARYFPGLYIEFKAPKWRERRNGGLSCAQQEFISYALARGYQCRVCYSWEEGRDAVVEYLNIASQPTPPRT